MGTIDSRLTLMVVWLVVYGIPVLWLALRGGRWSAWLGIGLIWLPALALISLWSAWVALILFAAVHLGVLLLILAVIAAAQWQRRGGSNDASSSRG